jgi:hypothetical protein
MIVKRDGMGLAAPNPKILGSDLGKLPTAGYPANPLTKMPIPPSSASAADLKPSLFYSPVATNPTFNNAFTPTNPMTAANLSAFNANSGTGSVRSLGNMSSTFNISSIGTVTPIGTTSESFINSNLSPVTPLGTINHALNSNGMGLVTHIGTMNASSIGNNNFSPATPVGTTSRLFSPAQASSSNDDFGSDNEDEIQITKVAEREAKRRAERIAFARTFGDAIRSTTGDDVVTPFRATLSLDTVPLVTESRLHTVQQAVDATW